MEVTVCPHHTHTSLAGQAWWCVAVEAKSREKIGEGIVIIGWPERNSSKLSAAFRRGSNVSRISLILTPSLPLRFIG